MTDPIATPSTTPNQPAVLIVILNYRTVDDTLECLESLYRQDYPNFHIMVVDNASRDASLEKIGKWARGSHAIPPPRQQTLTHLAFPPVAKPIPYSIISTQGKTLRSEGNGNGETLLKLLQTTTNKGYGAGVNYGLRYALQHDEYRYVWLLNNDTVVEPDALSEMVARMESDDRLGMCGATVVYYDRPELLQAAGGATYNPWLATARHVAIFERSDSEINPEAVEKLMVYPAGSAILVSRPFLEKVGLLSEEYFLYFEEMDWVMRSRKFGFRIGYACDARIYHKEGTTTGASNLTGAKTTLTDYYGNRNRLKFTAKYYPAQLPTVWLALLLSAVKRIASGRWQAGLNILRIMVGMKPAGLAENGNS